MYRYLDNDSIHDFSPRSPVTESCPYLSLDQIWKLFDGLQTLTLILLRFTAPVSVSESKVKHQFSLVSKDLNVDLI